MAFFPAAANFMLQTQQQQHNDSTDHHIHEHRHHPSTASLTSLLPSCSPHHQDFHGGGGHEHDVELAMLGKRSMSFPTGLEMCSTDHHQDNNYQLHHPNMNNGGMGMGMGTGGGDDQDLSEDDGSQLVGGGGVGEKKRRLNMEQVKTLEKNFELGNKLEPERKIQLAKALGLQPRQIAIWFQNRRARWKTKQLEKDYNILKRQFDTLKSDNENLVSQNHKLQAQIMVLKQQNGNREPTESINLNKENTEAGTSASSNRSSDENSSHQDHHIKLDISRSTPPTPTTTIDHQDHNNIHGPLSAAAAAHHHHHPATTRGRTSMPLFPPSSSSGILRDDHQINNDQQIPHHLHLHMAAQQLSFHPSLLTAATTPPDHDHDHDDLHPDFHHQNKLDHQSAAAGAAAHHVKEENGTFSNMFVGMDDQSVFWPWLEQPN